MFERVVVPMRLAVASRKVRKEQVRSALTTDRVEGSSEPSLKLCVSALSLSNAHGD